MISSALSSTHNPSGRHLGCIVKFRYLHEIKSTLPQLTYICTQNHHFMKHILTAFFATTFLFVNFSLRAQTSASLSPGDTTWKTKVTKTKEEWKKILTPDQYTITREEGTERPFTKNNFNDNHQSGMYYCVCCQNPLFNSVNKFDSGTGWPSFWRAYASSSIELLKDNSLSMERTAVSCKRCGAHLGHVFNDGPKPTGLRYCMDGLALMFIKS